MLPSQPGFAEITSYLDDHKVTSKAPVGFQVQQYASGWTILDCCARLLLVAIFLAGKATPFFLVADDLNSQRRELFERERQMLGGASEAIKKPDEHEIEPAFAGILHQSSQQKFNPRKQNWVRLATVRIRNNPCAGFVE